MIVVPSGNKSLKGKKMGSKKEKCGLDPGEDGMKGVEESLVPCVKGFQENVQEGKE